MHDRDAIQLLEKAGCSSRVIAHCRVVQNVALGYAARTDCADRTLVSNGALLHDIGRGMTHSILHAQAGAALARHWGVPEEAARIVECHTGAGLTADENTLLRLLPVECIPETVEEKIVAHADNLVRGSRVITFEERLALASVLPRRVRRRLYHLSLWVEVLCG